MCRKSPTNVACVLWRGRSVHRHRIEESTEHWGDPCLCGSRTTPPIYGLEKRQPRASSDKWSLVVVVAIVLASVIINMYGN